MRPVSPVLPADPQTANGELKIAEHQPEYGTLPALHCGQCVILTRWEFEEGERERFAAGAALRLTVLHGEGGFACRHLIETNVCEASVPGGFRDWTPEPQTDARLSVFVWQPVGIELEQALTLGGVFLYQWTGGHKVQPLILEAEEVKLESR